jgi:alpha-tubulin suppressor-like RCC1 family protein
VACGTDFTALLDEKEGRLFTFGNGEAGQLGHGEKGLCLEPSVVPLDDVKDVVGGGAHMLALTSTRKILVTIHYSLSIIHNYV